MTRSLRRRTSALLVAAALLAGLAGLTLAAPATAAPPEDPAGVWAPKSSVFFAKLLAWLEQWSDEDRLQSISGAGGHSMDPNGEPASLSFEPGVVEPVAGDEGHDRAPDA